MRHFKYIVLGAGPAGLTFAARMAQAGEQSILILEKEKAPGGLCRSCSVDGSPLDIGGGHFLDVRNRRVLDFLFQFLPENEWRRFSRISTIRMGSDEVDYPLESNIWQFPQDLQQEFLSSIARAGCLTGDPRPEAFVDWIVWKFGDKIADAYMLPYNRKIWGENLNALGTYWLEKLPDVSYEDILESCRTRSPHGKIPAHQVFLYPREYGYGEVWKRMGISLDPFLRSGAAVTHVDMTTGCVNGEFTADRIVWTVPWPSVVIEGMPEGLREGITQLAHVGIAVSYIPEDPPTDAHWTYCPDESALHHRELYRANFLKGARGYWTETRLDRARVFEGARFDYEFAYPLNTRGKPEIVKELIQWARARAVYPLGRWGEWEHYNSDRVVDRALDLAEELLCA